MEQTNELASRKRSWRPDLSAAVLRRPGRSPRDLGVSLSGQNCPDVLELDNGDFLVIGADVSRDFGSRLPPDAGVGAGEAIVMVPAATVRSTLAGMAPTSAAPEV